ncbi:leucyl aminopeptidase family protein [Parvularcula dongshanensis]|uniref:Leucyl aminopeptidase n=1 Tax=Parvularcula dongshanensis TaxID=1173995 RepID=A0A840I0V2_9PROT|nr:leucyl aminopeptidase family protein [Parvularcula dongshanensis]MBB4657730.1 leucyl aminopeptidase [Parvularcula dongshanensis]
MPRLPDCLVAHDHDRYEAAVPLRLVPAAQGSDLGAVAARARFEGGLGQVLALQDEVLVGTGDGSEPLALGAAAAALGEGDYRVEGETGHLDLLAWALGAYRYERYKKGAPVPTLILPAGADTDRLAREVEASYLVRDLVNTPTEDMGPADLEAAARRLAKTYGADIEVTEGAALEEGFPLVHAVGRAAATPPRLLDLRWGESGPSVTLVGKGVCFDTGGLNIKTGKGMGLMKKDMGGAANVLGLATLVMAAGLEVRLRVLVPAVENAVAGNAFRPGDVFCARDGQTVEISNTDAEGRLILADALAYAAEEAPDRIVSFATLTGAARVALGPDLPPIYATDEDFAHAVRRAGDEVADPVWPMPFWSRYQDYLKSPIADVNHAADTPFAGSITAALFLRRFVGTVPYAHLDIYAWTPSARPGRPLGGEAMGMRAVFGVLAAG